MDVFYSQNRPDNIHWTLISDGRPHETPGSSLMVLRRHDDPWPSCPAADHCPNGWTPTQCGETLQDLWISVSPSIHLLYFFLISIPLSLYSALDMHLPVSLYRSCSSQSFIQFVWEYFLVFSEGCWLVIDADLWASISCALYDTTCKKGYTNTIWFDIGNIMWIVCFLCSLV